VEQVQTTSIMWFRRDLRLADNPALCEAAAAAESVLPLFVVDPHLWGPAGPSRRAYLAASLAALDDALDGHLVVRHGDPVEVLPRVAREVAAGSVHVAADHGPYGARRDTAVAAALAARGVPLHRLGSPYAVAPGRVTKPDGSPYRVFSPFLRAWLDHGWRAPVAPPRGVAWCRVSSEPLPQAGLPGGLTLPVAGEEAARERWRAFRDERLGDYDRARDRPDLPGTSQMSLALRWGEVHPRTLLADLAQRRSNAATTYRSELAWREFHADVLHHRPDTARSYLRGEFAGMEYDEPDGALDAWREGRTGFPLVDAGMRQLRATGWMHNRVRMVTASFLVKDLHIEWQHGARHFMRWLADGDLASNQHGWQWVAGCGTDAAPYFRVFNPTAQGRRFDPDGDYVRRWVPELHGLSGADVHEPSRAAAGRPEGYPEPIVDHAAERTEALARLERIGR
jgi:deoxyribodipyrimidine photo-lyase